MQRAPNHQQPQRGDKPIAQGIALGGGGVSRPSMQMAKLQPSAGQEAICIAGSSRSRPARLGRLPKPLIGLPQAMEWPPRWG